MTLFRLVPKSDSPIPKGLRLDSSLDIVTNVSVITVPVLCYDGKIIKVSFYFKIIKQNLFKQKKNTFLHFNL